LPMMTTHDHETWRSRSMRPSMDTETTEQPDRDA